jgi:hypothetical protein
MALSFERILSPALERLEVEESDAALAPADNGGPPIRAPKTELLDGFGVEIADRPMAFRLESVCRARGVPMPEGFALYAKSFDLWLVPHRVSVVRRNGLSEITSLGIAVRYLVEEDPCVVVSLLPEARFVDAGRLTFAASTDLHGNLSAVETIDNLGPVAEGMLRVGVEASLGASLAFELTLVSPIVSAVGKGSSRAEWMFEQKGPPLHGRDIETWSVLCLPPGRTSIDYEISLSLVRRLAFLPTRRETTPRRLTCRLVEAEAPQLPALMAGETKGFP